VEGESIQDHVGTFTTEVRRRFAFLEEPPHALRFCGAFLMYPDEPRDTHTIVRYAGQRVVVDVIMDHIGLGLSVLVAATPPGPARVRCRKVTGLTFANFDDFLIMTVGAALPASKFLGRFRVPLDYANWQPGWYARVAARHLVDLIDLIATRLRDYGAGLLAGDADLIARANAFGNAPRAPHHGGVPRHDHVLDRQAQRRRRFGARRRFRA
jgi:hypothetical protein